MDCGIIENFNQRALLYGVSEKQIKSPDEDKIMQPFSFGGIVLPWLPLQLRACCGAMTT